MDSACSAYIIIDVLGSVALAQSADLQETRHLRLHELLAPVDIGDLVWLDPSGQPTEPPEPAVSAAVLEQSMLAAVTTIATLTNTNAAIAARMCLQFLVRLVHRS